MKIVNEPIESYLGKVFTSGSFTAPVTSVDKKKQFIFIDFQGKKIMGKRDGIIGKGPVNGFVFRFRTKPAGSKGWDRPSFGDFVVYGSVK